ncbi:MAG: sigma-54-dependent Fis family transcriptional regulator [Bacteroidetes bacterium]|nr:MAG: sigma-54-dependent Fis family transcriptional regulator [Bacteroidota bacterium]
MTKRTSQILIVDDDKAFRVATSALLQDAGYTVSTASEPKEALQKIVEGNFDVILSDLVMEGMNGIEFLQHIKNKLPQQLVIMVTGFGSVKTAVEAMRLGAYDYLTKPCSNDELLIKVQRAVEQFQHNQELRRLKELLCTSTLYSGIVSQSEKMKEVFKLVQQVAETDVTVLVLGETGTGKELLARAIHYNSIRRDMPFVEINCSAIPESLLESELFGHEKGAFTGANKQRIGKFEEAIGGSLFLDEIGDIPLTVQTKLLRVLQQKQVTRLGGNSTIDADVRLIAATNRNLEEMVTNNQFREDLFYRLNVFPINLPPLRERLEDIPLLAEHLLEKHRSLTRQPIEGFSPSVIHAMMNYDWKGNVRELENLIKRAIIKAGSPTISQIELPRTMQEQHSMEKVDLPSTTLLPYRQYMEQVQNDAEKKYLSRILKESKGNLNQVARLMDVDRKTVYRKIEEHGIEVEKFKE